MTTSLVIAPGATLHISGGLKLNPGTTVTNYGNVVIGTGNVSTVNGNASWMNAEGGKVIMQSSSPFVGDGFQGFVMMTNWGDIVRNGSLPESAASLGLENHGLLQVQTGTLKCPISGSGVFHAGAGATFLGGAGTLEQARFEGDGLFILSGSVKLVEVSIAAETKFELSGCDIRGGSSIKEGLVTLNVSTNNLAFTATSGSLTLQKDAVLRIYHSIKIIAPANVTNYGHVIIGTNVVLNYNGQSIATSGSVSGSGVWLNEAGGILELQSANPFSTTAFAEIVTITNRGLVKRTGQLPESIAGVSRFVNNGVLHVERGVLRCSNMSGSGVFQTDSGATLKGGSDFSRSFERARFEGGGLCMLSGGGQLVDLVVAGGTRFELVAFSIGDGSSIKEGTVTINVDTNNLNLGVTSRNFTVKPDAILRVSSSLQFNAPYHVTNYGHVIIDTNVVLYSGQNIATSGSVSGSGVWLNEAGGVLELQSANPFSTTAFAEIVTITNRGLVKRTGQLPESLAWVSRFVNEGTLQVETGTLRFHGSSSVSGSGLFTIVGKIILPGSAGTMLNVLGTGVIENSSGTLLIKYLDPTMTVQATGGTVKAPARIQTIENISPNSASLAINIPIGGRYVLQRSSDLTIWLSISTNTLASTQTFRFTDNLMAGGQRWFYRLITQ